MTEPDYGYGDAAPSDPVDYGYGDDAAPAVDYGYGDAPAAAEDYGYGEAAPDYGYGDAAPAPPAQDYGYGDDAAPAAEPSQESRRPKRRCSVTRYTIENEDKESALTAHTRIRDFRNGVDSGTDPVPVDDANKSTHTNTTSSTSDENSNGNNAASGGIKKKGVMHRIRKRLSIIT